MGKRTRAKMRAVSAWRISRGYLGTKDGRARRSLASLTQSEGHGSRYSRLAITHPQQVSTDPIKSERERAEVAIMLYLSGS